MNDVELDYEIYLSVHKGIEEEIYKEFDKFGVRRVKYVDSNRNCKDCMCSYVNISDGIIYEYLKEIGYTPDDGYHYGFNKTPDQVMRDATQYMRDKKLNEILK